MGEITMSLRLSQVLPWRLVILFFALGTAILGVLEATYPKATQAQQTCRVVKRGFEITQAAQFFEDLGEADNSIPLLDSRATAIRVYFDHDPNNPGICGQSPIRIDGTVVGTVQGGIFSGQQMVNAKSDGIAEISANGSERTDPNSTLNFTFGPSFFNRGANDGGQLGFQICFNVQTSQGTVGGQGDQQSQTCFSTGSISFAKPCGLDVRAMSVPAIIGQTVKQPRADRIKRGRADSTFFALHPVPMISNRTRYLLSTSPTNAYTLTGSLDSARKEQTFACDMAMRRFGETVVPHVMAGWVEETVPTTEHRGMWCVGGGGLWVSDREMSFQRSLAHELFHEFIGDAGHVSGALDMVGWDVFDITMKPTKLGKIKVSQGQGGQQLNLRTPGQDTNVSWIKGSDYELFRTLIESKYKCRSLRGIPPLTPVRPILISISDTEAWGIEPSFVLTSSADLTPAGGEGSGTLRILDSFGGDVYSIAFSIYTSTARALFVTPGDIDAHQIQVLENGVIKASITRSTHAPQVTITSPLPGTVLSAGSVVTWQMTDADDDSLQAIVQYSADDGQTWLPIVMYFSNTYVPVPTDHLPSSLTARIRVTATDGVNTAMSEVSQLQLGPNKPPSIVIVAPTAGEVFRQGSNVTLAAFADDLEEGDITPANVAWYSNLNGYLGTGSMLNIANLVVGPHNITVSASDSQGAFAIESVFIEVY